MTQTLSAAHYAPLAELRARMEREVQRLSGELSAPTPPPAPTHRPERRATQRDARRELRLLAQLASGLSDITAVPAERAGYGSILFVRDLATGRERVHTLVGDRLDPLDAGQVALSSPLGQALAGRRAGELVTVPTPHGNGRLRVLTVRTLHQRLRALTEE